MIRLRMAYDYVLNNSPKLNLFKARFALVLLFFLVFEGRCIYAREPDKTSVCKTLPANQKTDSVWGGVLARFDSLETKDFIYVGYYDAERWFSVSQINKCTGKVQKVRLPSRFTGWDAHNNIKLALDSAGRLHVAGNMHASPLVYARMVSPDNLASLAELKPMVGREEEKTTYPNFFSLPDGTMLFSYRYGHSGEGKELINRFDGERWSRWVDRPLFAPESDKHQVNAYHSGFVYGQDGFFHTAWVWREPGGVENNFNVNYAKSRDLKSWQNSKGGSLALPITPKNAEVVDFIPKGKGLFNNVKLGFDAEGHPVISYLKFDKNGYSQLYHARRESKGWKLVQSTDWKFRWDPRGDGTIKTEISIYGVQVRDKQLLELVKQPEIGNVTLKYSPVTLRVESIIKDYPWGNAPHVKREFVPGAVKNVQAVLKPDGNFSQQYGISWLTHPADNRDRPRDCKPTGLPCDFVSDLYLHTSPK